jgi:Na+/melibiose symporter-like transporter
LTVGGPAPSGRYPSLALVERTIEKQLDAQFSHVESLDTKAGLLLGFLAVSLAALVPTGQFKAATIWLTVAVVAAVVALLLCLVSLGRRHLRRDPRPRALRELYPSAPKTETLFALADSYVVSYEMNQRLIAWKVSALRLALAAIAVAVIGLGLHLLLGW